MLRPFFISRLRWQCGTLFEQSYLQDKKMNPRIAGANPGKNFAYVSSALSFASVYAKETTNGGYLSNLFSTTAFDTASLVLDASLRSWRYETRKFCQALSQQGYFIWICERG